MTTACGCAGWSSRYVVPPTELFGAPRSAGVVATGAGVPGGTCQEARARETAAMAASCSRFPESTSRAVSGPAP